MTAVTPSLSPNPLYEDSTRLIKERVDDLISRMTVEEKISQMVFDAPAIERLGIPAYNWWNECLHGVARAGVATVFPQAIGLAATWDIALMGEVATAISDEARAKHHEFVRRGVRQIYTGLTYWSPNVNIFRDPRWGRGQETYGEDPYLTARMGVTFVRGLQGDDPRYLKLVATPKHFAVHSGPELSRHEFDARVSERDLRETYLPAFEACMKEGAAASIMGAYNRMNGEPCCANPRLLQKILREEWGFEGYVVSDCWAINDIFGGHGVVETPAEASALAVKVGCDLECGCTYPSLHQAVELGLIDEATIDRAVTRLFTARFHLGMFDPPEQVPFAGIPYEINDSTEHRALALRAAREAIVLLKNDGLLPLAKELKSVAIIGPNADDLAVLLGNYCGTPAHAVTPLEGIRRKVSPETIVYTAQGCEITAGVLPLHPVPAACLRPPADSTDHASRGLSGAYFPGRVIPDPLQPLTFNPSTGSGQALQPSIVRIDPVVDFAWHVFSPLGGQVTEPFCVRWRGTLIPPTSGRYLLGVRGSSGYELRLDGRELLPYETNDHEVFTRTIPLDLEGGRLYDVRLDYTNTGRTPEVQLLWAVPGEDYAVEALRVAEKAEVVVMVMGLSPTLEGEDMPVHVEGFAGGDRTDIALPATQEALLRRIAALSKPVVLVLLGGSALAVDWADAHVPAILAAWYPGEEGGTAIADVLFGDFNPAGRLPVTFYKSLDQLPPFDDYALASRTYRYLAEPPLYPFGHGLSYARFAYGDLAIDPPQISPAGQARVTVKLTNVGERAGDEVVQLYVGYPDAAVPRPVKELRGFSRVTLAPGEMQTVQFTLAADQLRWWDGGGWAIKPGKVQVLVGSSSEDIRLQGEVHVSAT
jgi:beta-glucosidase